MGGVAALARAAGHQVTGCDSQVYPPMSDQLRLLQIDLIEGFGEEQLRLQPDLFVIGNVVSRGNPLMEAILDRGLPYISGPQWLAEHILRDKWVLAVAGTHGKTTTSALLAWILDVAGLNPGFLIGGVANDFPVSARLTDSPFFVIEADEYDTAFFDKRSKFVHYRPRTLILNNLEFDHADIFADLAAIETQFHHLVRTVPRQGRILAHDEPSLRRVIARGCWTPVEWLGAADGWHAAGDPAAFEVRLGEVLQTGVHWGLLGEHNMANALAAIAAARHAGVPPQVSAEALARFSGIRRRLEVRGTADGVTVYDDFAHHPTAIAATLGGLRRKVGTARILAVLDPRSNTMKQGALKDALPASLDEADLVFCHAAGLAWDARAVFAGMGAMTQVFDAIEPLAAAVVASAQPGDHVLVMSNGGFGNIHERILQGLRERASAAGGSAG